MNEQEMMTNAMMKENYIDAIKSYVENKSKNDEQLLKALDNEKKTYEKCWSYIMRKAKDHLNNKSGHIMPSIVFGWAIHYFIEDESVLEKEVGKSIDNETTVKPKSQKEVKVQKEEKKNKSFETLSIFDFGVDE
ncbi:hypothetical protein BK011_06745 [Tenericutes bacterium MZ-XQ]|nr:hypothetical protein BK011_06745 [Tenericutes bacterium MZ-XQ]